MSPGRSRNIAAAAGDTQKKAGEVRVELSDPSGIPNPHRQREKSECEVTEQQHREPESGIGRADYVGVEERHHRGRNCAGDARDDVGAEQNSKRAVAQRAADAGHQRIRFAGDEIGALFYSQHQQTVEHGEQNAKKNPEPEEHLPIGEMPHLDHNAGRGRGHDRAEDRERLTPGEQRRALVVILRQFRAERIVRQNTGGVKYKIEDEGHAEPNRGAATSERRRRIQQEEKSHAAKWSADQDVRSATAQARMRVIGDPAHQRIAQRVERTRDRDRHRQVSERYQHHVGIELRHMNKDRNDHASARETRGAVEELGLKGQWLVGSMRGSGCASAGNFRIR